MGAILDLLKGGKDMHEVYIDFENAKPSNSEIKVWTSVNEVLTKGAGVLKTIEDYKGVQDLCRKAMQAPTKENEKTAFDGLLGVVDSISLFFTYAKRLEEMLPTLLDSLARPNDEAKDYKMLLQAQQALAKQLADVFDFTLRFDSLRMMRPMMSNDFSYYRRLLPKFMTHTGIKVKDDEAGGMALFTAEHIPMMNSLCRAANKALQQNENVITALSVMANSCLSMIRGKKFASVETNLFMARAMTGAIVLFDHIDPLGVFSRRSPINIRAAVTLLKREFPREQVLVNAIQYSSKTFKNAPSNIQDLFN